MSETVAHPLAVWHTPVRIAWPYASAKDGYQVEDVFTHTLVIPDIVDAFETLRPKVDGSALPKHRRLPVAARIEPALAATRRLAEHVGYFELERLALDLTDPDHTHDKGGVFGNVCYPADATPLPPVLPAEPVPDSQLRALLHCYGTALGEFADDLSEVAADVARAAQAGARFPAGRARPAAGVWNTYGASDRYPRLVAPLRQLRISTGTRTRSAWGHVPDSLLGRIALEAEQLAFERPRVQPCGACGRTFVPLVREAHCRGHLWRWPTGPLRAACERGAAFTVQTGRTRGRTAHERWRDSTYQQIRRWKLERERSAAPIERERLTKMIADLATTRREGLKQRGPATTRPVVIEQPRDEREGRR